MAWNTKKYNKQIEGIKLLESETSLHPLRREQIKTAVFENIRSQPAYAKQVGYANLRRRGKITVWFAKYSAVIIAGLGLVTFTAFASNNAKPGDVLFPVKKVVEQAQIVLAPSDQSKAELQAKFAQRRLQELSQVAADKQAPQQFKAEVAEQTQTEVNKAINVLNNVQRKLEDQGNGQGAQDVVKASQQLMRATQATKQEVTAVGIDLHTEDDANAPAVKENSQENPGKRNDNKPGREVNGQQPAGTQINVKQPDSGDNGKGSTQPDNENSSFDNNSGSDSGFNLNLFFRPKNQGD